MSAALDILRDYQFEYTHSEPHGWIASRAHAEGEKVLAEAIARVTQAENDDVSIFAGLLRRR